MDQGESQVSVQCAAGCGFFGNPASENMCSKCFRDLRSNTPAAQQQQQQQQQQLQLQQQQLLQLQQLLQQPKTSVPQPSVVRIEPAAEATASSSASMAPAAAEDSASSGTPSPKKPKNRCTTCRKKVGLLGFECRCEGLFCSMHRHATDHECTFDYMTFDRDLLTKANPVISPEKVPQI